MGYTAIVDYGVGNLKSVANAMDYLGLDTGSPATPESWSGPTPSSCPAWGPSPTRRRSCARTGLDRVVMAQAEKKPILGICLGMQLLFDGARRCGPVPVWGLSAAGCERIETH